MGNHAAALRAETATTLRAKIEADIERLITLLDALDGDPDLEPSIGGWSPFVASSGNVDLEGDFSDWEPSLGWPEPVHANSARIAGGVK